MSRPSASFIVSGPLGSGNWETDASPLKRKELLFPEVGQKETALGKQKNVDAAPPQSPAAGGAPRITRVYKAGPLADQLIELLYELLAMTGVGDQTLANPAAPCFSSKPE